MPVSVQCCVSRLHLCRPRLCSIYRGSMILAAFLSSEVCPIQLSCYQSLISSICFVNSIIIVFFWTT